MFKGLRLEGDAIRLRKALNSVKTYVPKLLEQGYYEEFGLGLDKLMSTFNPDTMTAKGQSDVAFRLIEEGHKLLNYNTLNGSAHLLAGTIIGNLGLAGQYENALGKLSNRSASTIHESIILITKEVESLMDYLVEY